MQSCRNIGESLIRYFRPRYARLPDRHPRWQSSASWFQPAQDHRSAHSSCKAPQSKACIYIALMREECKRFSLLTSTLGDCWQTVCGLGLSTYCRDCNQCNIVGIGWCFNWLHSHACWIRCRLYLLKDCEERHRSRELFHERGSRSRHKTDILTVQI